MRTIAELEQLVAISEITGYQENLDRFRAELKTLKKKEAHHGRSH